MPFCCFNNTFISSEDFKVNSSNRSFRYGDGLFETIFVSNQIPLFLPLHIQRLVRGMKFLHMNFPSNWTIDFFSNQICELTKKNNYKNARCRITVWRGGEGYYLPNSNQPELLIELTETENEYYILNQTGLKLGLFGEVPKMMHPISAFKTAQAMPYVLASLFAREQNFDDVVILNNEGRVADATSSNIFIYRDRKLFTPAIGEGGVDGVTKKVIITLCLLEGIEVSETKIESEDLLIADEIFLSNSINGIKWVESFQNKKYTNQFSTDLIFVLNEQKNNNTLVSP